MLTLALLVAALQQAPQPAPQNVLVLAQIEQDMITECNAYRASKGLAPLVADGSLMVTAREQSRIMATRGSMRHGFTRGWSAENIAWNQANPKEVTRTWINSPGHRRNMLGRFTRIGVGAMTAGRGIYWTQQFR